MRLDTLHSLGTIASLPRQSPINSEPDWMRKLFTFLSVEEGFRDKPYFDRSINAVDTHNNYLARATIGYGVNVEDDPAYLKLVLREMGIINGTMSKATIDARVVEFSNAINRTPHGREYNATLESNLNAVAQKYGVPTFAITQVQSDNIFLGVVDGLNDGNIVVQGKRVIFLDSSPI